jgi:hypothetical protein
VQVGRCCVLVATAEHRHMLQSGWAGEIAAG